VKPTLRAPYRRSQEITDRIESTVVGLEIEKVLAVELV
jgi:hypothetical protein